MASGYVRQATANIQPNLEINAEDFNAEFDAIADAFDNTLGHDHSGSDTGTGAKIVLTTAVTGSLPVANGGTGDITLTDHGLMVGQATDPVVAIAAGTLNQLLISGGPSADPLWSDNINITGTAVLTGMITAGNVTTAGTVHATGNITSDAVLTGANIVTGGSLTATGSVIAGNISTAGTVAATGAITSGATLTGAAVVATTTPIAITSGGTGASTAAGAFANIAVTASAITQPGYIKFPNGLIIQWASVAFGGGNTQLVNFPIAFPSNVFAVTTGIAQAAGGTISIGAVPTLTDVTINLSTGASTTTWYIAIGN
jgi:hypothetical protein